MAIGKFLGRVLGAVTAPFTFLGGLVRGDRLFHPDGSIYRADVKPLAQDGALGLLAQRLAGTALVRVSGGLWKWPQGKRLPDVLGVAVRLRTEDVVTPELLPGDQDLLFASARTLPGLVVAPFRTNVNDYLDNTYYALLPFTLAGVGKVYLRLVPTQRSPAGGDRRERLVLAVNQGTAVLNMELKAGSGGWLPIAAIDLREQLAIKEAELAFDPGTSAMGLVPRGVLQWSRTAAYGGSTAGRRTRRED